MSEVSPTDLARDAFVRRKPSLVLTRASVALVLLNLLVLAGFLAATWSVWGEIIRWYLAAVQAAHNGAAPPGPPLIFQAIAAWALPVYLAGFVVFAAYEAACLRWLVRGESGGGFFGLTLGGDTWRVWLGYWVWLALLAVFTAAIVCFYVALNAINHALVGPVHILILLIAALAPIGLVALAIWGATLFAPAAATSIALKRFAFGSAPKVTRGRRWALVGAFVLVIGGYVVISIVTQMLLRIPINAAIQPILLRAVAGGQDAKTLLTALGHALSAPTIIALGIVYVVWAQVLACAVYVGCFGVNARAVRAALEDGAIASG